MGLRPGHEPENGMMNFSSSEANAASDAIEQASRDHFQCGLKLRLRDRQSLAAGPSGLAAKLWQLRHVGFQD